MPLVEMMGSRVSRRNSTPTMLEKAVETSSVTFVMEVVNVSERQTKFELAPALW